MNNVDRNKSNGGSPGPLTPAGLEAMVLENGTGHGSKLPRRREAVIAAVLLEPTLVKAAEAVGVAPRTLRNWLNRSDIQAAIDQARKETLDETLSALRRSAMAAAETLARNLNCGLGAVENAAAKAILDRVFQSEDAAELKDRIKELEAASVSGNGSPEHDAKADAARGEFWIAVRDLLCDTPEKIAALGDLIRKQAEQYHGPFVPAR